MRTLFTIITYYSKLLLWLTLLFITYFILYLAYLILFYNYFYCATIGANGQTFHYDYTSMIICDELHRICYAKNVENTPDDRQSS